MTPALKVDHLSARFGSFELQDIHLEIGAGEYFVLLGPTGAGKTVLMETIVGFHLPSRGRIFLGGKDVTRLPPELRNIGFLPQDYALFPSMTVRKNIAFGLEMHRASVSEIKNRVEALSDQLGLQALLDRYPKNLSGGEKQRVALARALAVSPSVVVLDEPLSALDESTRNRLCALLRKVQRESGAAFFHISHNFEETVSVADRIAVIHEGKIEQVGPCTDVIRRPQTRFVAEFVRTENLFEGESRPDGDGVSVSVNGAVTLRSSSRITGPVGLCVRPEEIRVLNANEAQDGANMFAAKVVAVRDRISSFRIELDAAVRWFVDLSPSSFHRLPMSPGTEVRIFIPPEKVHVFRL